MKNNIKKIIYAVAFGILFLTSSGQASAAWNTYPSDCPNPLSIGNYNTGEGIQNGSNGCWTKRTVSATAGQTINVAVYYDNTNNADANNVSINLNQSPAGSMNSVNQSYSFSGNLTSSVGSLSLNQVSVNISSSETLTFSQAKWFKKGSSYGASLPSGQTGYEAFNGGLSMGTIANNDWGTVIFSFSIGTTIPLQLCQDSNAINYGGALPCQYAQPLCSINSFYASPSSITNGDYSILNWSTNNCDSVVITPNVGNYGKSGSKTVYPTSTTTYTLMAYAQNGTLGDTDNITVAVNTPATMTGNLIASTSSCVIASGNSTCAIPFSWTTQNPEATSYITHNSSTVASGNNGSQSFYISNISNGSEIYGLYNNYKFLDSETVSATCASGTSWNGLICEPTIIINNNCSIDSFYASPSSITNGDYSTLNWSTSNCSSVVISNLGYNVPISGSQSVYPTSTKTYTLTAYGTGGTYQNRSVTVYVDDYNNNEYCSINSFYANDTYINSGDPVTLRWNTNDCDSVNISNIGNVSSSGSRIVYPSDTTTYILRAYGNRSESRSIQVNVRYNPIVIPIIRPTPIYNTNVVTTIATNVSQTGAQVNGLVTSSNYNNANVYFEYGKTVNLGIRTPVRSTNGNTNFSEYLTNLSPKTIYFFQAVSESSNGVSRGAIEVFQTLGYPTVVNNVQTVKKVIVQGQTVSESKSPIMLKIENRYQTIGKGDIVDYVVTYKNIGKSKLTNPMVQVFIPKGITPTNTSQGTYSESDRTLSVPIEDLNPNTEGVIYLQARVDSIDSNLAQIVTTAVLVYTNPNNTQENAMAYVLNSPKNNNLLGASAFFGNIFGLDLIGWLIVVIFILLLVLVARTLSNRRNVASSTYAKK